MKFSELIRLFRRERLQACKRKRVYTILWETSQAGTDYHGSKEVPTGTCHAIAIIKASGIKK